MTLVVDTLKNAFIKTLTSIANETEESDSSESVIEKLAGKLAVDVDTYIKTGTVTVTVAPGIATAGTSPSGPTTGVTVANGTGTGSIS